MSSAIITIQFDPEEVSELLESLTVHRALKGTTDAGVSAWWKLVGGLGELKVELEELEPVEEEAVIG